MNVLHRHLLPTNKRYYDDYNLIYETTEFADTTRSTEVKKYYFGTDLQGNVYGIAGTGGLRMMELNGKTVYVFNNIIGSTEALYSADSENINEELAEYVYSAYGEIMFQNGSLAESNPITYSTRYKESNTGLVGYTFRHYSPRLMKWINKDPIAEQGGLNLYQMVGGDPVNSYDVLGHETIEFSVVNTDNKDHLCRIDIFVGHGTYYGQPNNKYEPEGDIEKAMANAAAKGLDPSGYAIGGSGCFAQQLNMYAGNNGYKNPNRPSGLTTVYYATLTGLENEVTAAKKHAESNMCNKSPACCTKIKVKPTLVSFDFSFIMASIARFVLVDYYEVLYRMKRAEQDVTCTKQ